MCARRSQSPFAAPSTPLALLQLENDLLHSDRAFCLLAENTLCSQNRRLPVKRWCTSRCAGDSTPKWERDHCRLNTLVQG